MPDEGVQISLFCASLEEELHFKKLDPPLIDILSRHREKIVYFTDYAKLVVYSVLGKEVADDIWRDNPYPINGGAHTLFELYWISTVINPETSWELKTNAVEREPSPRSQPSSVKTEKKLSPLKKRLPLVESFIKDNVIGQPTAVQAVIDVLYRTAAGLNDPDRPQAVLLFTGPSGVGKTHMAKVLSVALYEEEVHPDKISSPSAYFRIDCTLYQQKHEISNLIGSPQGYVGSDMGSPLPNFLKEHPDGCVILIDEVEKAHPSLHKMFMGLFDYGKIKDNKQQDADASQALFIMTSNAGSQEAKDDLYKAEHPLGFALAQAYNVDHTTNAAYKKKLDEVFPPELQGRIDDTIIFDHLNEEACKGILDLEIKKLDRRLKDRGILLRVTAGARNVMVKDSMSPQTGARNLSSHIREQLVRPLSRMIVTSDEERYVCRSKDNKIIVEPALRAIPKEL